MFGTKDIIRRQRFFFTTKLRQVIHYTELLLLRFPNEITHRTPKEQRISKGILEPQSQTEQFVACMRYLQQGIAEDRGTKKNGRRREKC